MNGQLLAIDPDSEKARSLRYDLEDLETRHAAKLASSLETRRCSADSLLNKATKGNREALQDLAKYAAAVSPKFGEAITQARGDFQDLVATVRELLASAAFERGEMARLKSEEAGTT